MKIALKGGVLAAILLIVGIIPGIIALPIPFTGGLPSIVEIVVE